MKLCKVQCIYAQYFNFWPKNNHFCPEMAKLAKYLISEMFVFVFYKPTYCVKLLKQDWSRPFFAKECLIEMHLHLIDFIFRMWSTSSTIMGLPTQWRHDSFNFRDWWSLPPWIEPEPKWSTFCHKEPQIRWINIGKYEYMYAYQLYM